MPMKQKPVSALDTLKTVYPVYLTDAAALAYALTGDKQKARELVLRSFLSLYKRLDSKSLRGNMRVYMLCYMFGSARKPEDGGAPFFSLPKQTRALYALRALPPHEVSAILSIPGDQIEEKSAQALQDAGELADGLLDGIALRAAVECKDELISGAQRQRRERRIFFSILFAAVLIGLVVFLAGRA